MRHRVSVTVVAVMLMAVLLPTAFAQRFSDWGAPVHVDAPVNTYGVEVNPVLSRDGLTLYYQSGPNGGPYRVHVTHRTSVDDPWGEPVFVGDMLGEGLFISTDGHRAYFSRVMADGKADLFVARRQDRDDDFGWRAPESLGAAINTSANEKFPFLYEDEATGAISLYFASDRPGGIGGDDIYVSTIREDGTLGDPVPVWDLNSNSTDRQIHIRRDGLECVLMSNRVGSMPGPAGSPSNDIWVATRPSTSAAWSAPVNMGPGINSGRLEGFASYSFDGSQLWFHAAQRVGNFDPNGSTENCPSSPTCYLDIWVATREKATRR